MREKILAAAMAVSMAVSCLTGCGSSGGTKGTVTTDGSTSMEKVIGALGESFMKQNQGLNFSYNPTGSGSGISAVANGTCDIGLSSRNLKEEEKAGGLQETVLAIDGIAVIVNKGNSVTELSLEQIAGIYTGKITRDGFESITGTKDACVLRQELTSTGDVIATVKSNENAIGYASLASVDDAVLTVSVGGVLPSFGTVLDGSYAIQRPFVLVTNEWKELSEAAKAFFDYALSQEAKEVIEGAGVVPAN